MNVARGPENIKLFLYMKEKKKIKRIIVIFHYTGNYPTIGIRYHNVFFLFAKTELPVCELHRYQYWEYRS